MHAQDLIENCHVLPSGLCVCKQVVLWVSRARAVCWVARSLVSTQATKTRASLAGMGPMFFSQL